jgi:t-SNARE complex subunit (syntaxin)
VLQFSIRAEDEMLNGLDEQQREEFEKLQMQLQLKGLEEAQKKKILQNQREILERDKELSQVLSSIQEIQEMFQEFQRILSEQQVSLDLIDKNLDKAEIKVEHGVENLKEAETWQSYTTCSIQ